MARLYPRVRPHQLLLTVEAIEKAPGLAAAIVGLALIALRTDPYLVGAATFATRLLLSPAICRLLFSLPGVLGLSRGFVAITGWGVIHAGVILFGIVFHTWIASLSYAFGVLAASIAEFVLEFARAKHLRNAGMPPLTGAEIAFLDAYRIYASAIGITTDVEITEEEVLPANVDPVISDLYQAYPHLIGKSFAR
jgi:hypothetical protein